MIICNYTNRKLTQGVRGVGERVMVMADRECVRYGTRGFIHVVFSRTVEADIYSLH